MIIDLRDTSDSAAGRAIPIVDAIDSMPMAAPDMTLQVTTHDWKGLCKMHIKLKQAAQQSGLIAHGMLEKIKRSDGPFKPLLDRKANAREELLEMCCWGALYQQVNAEPSAVCICICICMGTSDMHNAEA
ncbi:hypothetical protein MMC07_000375 [Pseudocyphellaria aurata]|nr:hypothetical protein [Pseudocyphellaria aurata]